MPSQSISQRFNMVSDEVSKFNDSRSRSRQFCSLNYQCDVLYEKQYNPIIIGSDYSDRTSKTVYSVNFVHMFIAIKNSICFLPKLTIILLNAFVQNQILTMRNIANYILILPITVLSHANEDISALSILEFADIPLSIASSIVSNITRNLDLVISLIGTTAAIPVTAAAYAVAKPIELLYKKHNKQPEDSDEDLGAGDTPGYR